MENNVELYHHGIKGMKWGVRRTAAQLGHRVASIPRKTKHAVSNVRDKRSVRSRERMRQKVIKSRSAKELYKHAELFSNDELIQMRDRLALEKRVKDLSYESSVGAKYVQKMSRVSDIFGKTASTAENGIKLYNNVARILNAKNAGNPEKKQLTIVGEKKEEKKKEDDKISIKTTRKFLDEHGNEMTEETTRKVKSGAWKPANERSYDDATKESGDDKKKKKKG